MIKCALCEEVGSSLALHVRKVHGIDKKDYIKKHGPVLASGSKERYSQVNKHNSQWISRAKERGEDLTQYWEKVSNGVRDAIMNSPEERKRRSEMLGALNKTDAFRKKSSETAKKTSARRDIQKSRAFALKKWRDTNRDEFHSKCTSNMHKYKSKPEKVLFEFMKESFASLGFENNRFLEDEVFLSVNKTKKKQVDVISSDRKTIIEFDGILHFKEVWPGQLQVVRTKDILLSKYAIEHDICLIRVSSDTYSYKVGQGFSDELIKKINDIICYKKPGVHFIGTRWNGSFYNHATSSEEVVKIYGV